MFCFCEKQGPADAHAIPHTFFGRKMLSIRGVRFGDEVRENEVTTLAANDDERCLWPDRRASVRSSRPRHRPCDASCPRDSRDDGGKA